MRFFRLLLAIVVIPAAGCSAAGGSDDLFSNEEAALAFTKSLGPGWGKPVERESGHKVYGLDVTLYTFALEEQVGRAAVGTDQSGLLRFYEVRFPVEDDTCIGTPNADELARLLLENTEPAFVKDRANVTLLASLSRLVWPQTALSSGPAAQVGGTRYQFYKMNGYCSVQVTRLAGRD